VLFQVALRVIIGVIFAGLGYFLADRLLSPISVLGSTVFIPTIVAFALGAIGVFLIPAVTTLSRRFFFNFVRLLAREILAQIRFPRIGRVELGRRESKTVSNQMILDTSAIIDGRIAEIAKTGFLDGTIIIPRFILGELQHIADSADSLRRGRGRRGFEVIEELKRVGDGLKVTISDLDFPKTRKADDKLVQLGRKLRAKVVTTDYNLNKVARISGVRILNVNELANSIKTVLLPGETISVKIIQEGKERDQGVGYMPDGTMIVVEGGNKLIGQSIDVEVARVFQTVAGRMVFVKPLKSVKA
jgi:uncharacterized protein YacL